MPARAFTGKLQLVTIAAPHTHMGHEAPKTGELCRCAGARVRWSASRLLALAATMLSILAVPTEAADREGATVTMAEVTVVLPGAHAALPITVGPPAATPPKSYIRIRGLPTTVTLTEGHNIAAGVWAIPLVSLPSLALRIPKGLSGKADIRASLVTLDGNVLSEARATLVIGPPALLAAPGEAGPTSDAGDKAPAPPAATGLDATPAHPDSGGGLRGAAVAGHAATPTETPPAAGGFLSSFPAQTAPATTHPPHVPHRDAELPPSANQARALLARGIKLIGERDIAGARRFFERACDLGLGEAAMHLAATYDPHELARQRGPGPPPDPKLARKWYERALALGVREAGLRLERLAAR